MEIVFGIIGLVLAFLAITAFGWALRQTGLLRYFGNFEAGIMTLALTGILIALVLLFSAAMRPVCQSMGLCI